MRDIVVIIAFALVWAVFFGQLSFNNLFIGLILGFIILSVLRREAESSFPKRAWGFVRYLGRFFLELLIANVLMARLALLPKPRLHPHVIAVPLEVKSDSAITLLAVTITLLPGTVAMGVSEDRKRLYAHAMGEADLGKLHGSIDRIQRLILGFMR